MRELLGGKGANVAEMTRVLGADRVPAGFTITTEACVAYMRVGLRARRARSTGGRRAGAARGARREAVRGRRRIRCSCRCAAARASRCPGCSTRSSTSGSTTARSRASRRVTDNERFAWDSYRRLVQMFGNVVRGRRGRALRGRDRRARSATPASTATRACRRDALRATGRASSRGSTTSRRIPQEQLRQRDPRRVRLLVGRARGRLPADQPHSRRLGNGGQRPADGVRQQGRRLGHRASRSAATRSPARPSRAATSSLNAQGEDVVSGVRTPRDISELAERDARGPRAAAGDPAHARGHYKDMQDIEFTVEEGRLYMLQTRNAKRPGPGRGPLRGRRRDEGLLTREEALRTIDAGALDALLHPTFDPSDGYDVLARGVAASPGAAKGEIVFTADEAVAAAARGQGRDPGPPVHRGRRRRRLPRRARASSPPRAARPRMRRSSRAGWGVPAVDRRRRLDDRPATPASCDRRAGASQAGDRIAIDGTDGTVVDRRRAAGRAARSTSASTGARVGRRAPPARRARQRRHAARTRARARARRRGHRPVPDRAHVHGRGPPAEDAGDDHGRDRDGRRAALGELLPLQQEDFEGLFEVMPGLPVTIRLLDPPLHEFLPDLPELRPRSERARTRRRDDLDELEQLLELVEEIDEVNPMLGTRGCRLGILLPGDLRDAGRRRSCAPRARRSGSRRTRRS